jgi:transposase InsO family protein
LTSPNELPPAVVAMVCELRRIYPRWGAQRIAQEFTLRGVEAPPSRSSVYRILVRHGLVAAQEQSHKRKYRRWQRDAPMQLRQLDIMVGVFLVDGRECTLITGIDDHARFVVMATVVAEALGARGLYSFHRGHGRLRSAVRSVDRQRETVHRAVHQALSGRGSVRTDLPGVRHHHALDQTPFTDTTGKIERFHKTLRRELLDSAGPFTSIAAAQVAIDAWVHGYNHSRRVVNAAGAAPGCGRTRWR